MNIENTVNRMMKKMKKLGRRWWLLLLATGVYACYSERNMRLANQRIDDLEDQIDNNMKGV